MSREHMPIQIGLPPEAAWEVAEPAPISYIAFVVGEEMPDPGAAFVAAGESFGTAPQDVEPLPIEDDRVVWAFAFALPGRAARVMLWCEHAIEGASPDGRAGEAKWVVFAETLLEASRAVDDAVALAATVARTGGARTRIVYDPGLGVAFARADIDRLFIDSAEGRAGELVDERHLYRVELVARDRAKGPFWISTVGLARVARPELEMLEVPLGDVRAALELVDALAARFVGEALPHAGVPFEAGPGLRLALVPAHEVIETLAAGAAGDAGDRRGLPRGPRAAICAAGRRGAFRQVWITPFDELAQLSRNEAGLFLAPRVSVVRERAARGSWGAFAAAFARPHGEAVFLAKVARGEREGERTHVWLAVDRADRDGGHGTLAMATGATETVPFAIGQVGDWRIVGLRPDLAEVGPESAGLLG